MRTFDHRKWTGFNSVADPIMRRGDLMQYVFLKTRNKIHNSVARVGALKVFDLRILCLFIIANRSKAFGHLYIGASCVNGPHLTWQIKFRFPWFDADWAAEHFAHRQSRAAGQIGIPSAKG